MGFFKKLFGAEPVPAGPQDLTTRPTRLGASNDSPPPYNFATRPMPSSEDIDDLLPPQLGTFARKELRRGDPAYATYQQATSEVFVELGICTDAKDAQLGVSTAKAETQPQDLISSQFCSIGTEPSFLKEIGPGIGAFVAWTRGRYYFSAHAKDGEAVLDRFMSLFPY